MRKLNTILSILTLALLSTTSCTVISSRNVPGEQQAEFPKQLQGTFELVYPAEFQSLIEADSTAGATRVEITATKLVQIEEDGSRRELILGDSIFFSTIGNDTYLSMGPTPYYTVMKAEISEWETKLYAMYTYEEVTKKDLKKYFKKVEIEKVVGEDGEEVPEDEDLGMHNYIVTIKDSKIDDFFKSKYAPTDGFTLRRIK